MACSSSGVGRTTSLSGSFASSASRISPWCWSRISIVYVGFVASGTWVLRALGVLEGGVAAVALAVCSEGIEVLDETSSVLGWALVHTWRSEGPSGVLWRLIAMGIEGLRYFMRGSISRQNFLGEVVLAVALADMYTIAITLEKNNS